MKGLIGDFVAATMAIGAGICALMVLSIWW